MYQQTDGPAVYGSISVLDSAASEVKIGGSPLEERKVLIIQPLDAKVYWGYDNTVSSSTGFLIGKKQIVFIEVGPDLPVYLISESGTADVRIAEVA